MKKKLRLLEVLTLTAVVPSLVAGQNIENPSDSVPEAQLASEPSHDSSRPGSRLPRIGQVAGVVVLNRKVVAIADGASGAIYFVDLDVGLVATDVPATRDPLDTPIKFLDRLPGNRLVAWRSGDGNFLKVYTPAGELEDSIPWPHAQVFGGPKLAGILPDRTLILRRSGRQLSIPGVPDLGSATLGNTIRYEVEDVRGPVVVAEATITDHATVTVPMSSGSSFLTARMIFGDHVLVTRAGAHLVVSPTDAPAAAAYDRKGSLAYTIPTPGARIPVDEAQITAQRYRRITEARESGSTGRQTDLFAAAAEYAGKEYVAVNTDSLGILQLPAKDTAPPIDRLLADPSGRVWFRLTPMPADTHTRWCVWDTSRREYAFSLKLSRKDSLLGVFARSVVLLRRDGYNQPRLLVTQFAIPGASRRPTVPPNSHCEKG